MATQAALAQAEIERERERLKQEEEKLNESRHNLSQQYM